MSEGGRAPQKQRLPKCLHTCPVIVPTKRQCMPRATLSPLTLPRSPRTRFLPDRRFLLASRTVSYELSYLRVSANRLPRTNPEVLEFPRDDGPWGRALERGWPCATAAFGKPDDIVARAVERPPAEGIRTREELLRRLLKGCAEQHHCKQNLQPCTGDFEIRHSSLARYIRA